MAGTSLGAALLAIRLEVRRRAKMGAWNIFFM
jgi:hypothetical protein